MLRFLSALFGNKKQKTPVPQKSRYGTVGGNAASHPSRASAMDTYNSTPYLQNDDINYYNNDRPHIEFEGGSGGGAGATESWHSHHSHHDSGYSYHDSSPSSYDSGGSSCGSSSSSSDSTSSSFD